MTPTHSGRVRARPEISVIIDAPDWRKDRALIGIVRRAAQLAAHPATAGNAVCSQVPSASVLLSSDKTIQELNSAFRKKNEPTNVLAFPALPQAAPYLGDVALAYGVVRREAVAQGKTLAAHSAHLTIHGILHLLGFDHHRQNDAKLMENQEICLLAQLGFANPYEAGMPVRKQRFRNKLPPCPTNPAR